MHRSSIFFSFQESNQNPKQSFWNQNQFHISSICTIIATMTSTVMFPWKITIPCLIIRIRMWTQRILYVEILYLLQPLLPWTNLSILLQWIFTHKTISFKESRNLSSGYGSRNKGSWICHNYICSEWIYLNMIPIVFYSWIRIYATISLEELRNLSSQILVLCFFCLVCLSKIVMNNILCTI